MTFRQEDVRIPVTQAELHGHLAYDPRSIALVIFAHGSGSGRHSPRNQFVARKLQEDGFSTLLFDLLTPREEEEDAVRNHLRFDIDFLAGRLATATHWVRQHLNEPMTVAYFGASTGAAAALKAASEDPDRISAVVSRGGRPDLAGESLQVSTSPTLLIVGELDRHVLLLNEHAARLLPDCDVAIVPEATHLFEEGNSLAHVAELASEWFSKHCGRHVPEPGQRRLHFGQLPTS